MTIFRKTITTYRLRRHNLLYLTLCMLYILLLYMIFLAFLSHNVSLRIDQDTKSNLIIYKFKKLNFCGEHK